MMCASRSRERCCASLVAVAAVFTAAFAVVSTIHTLVDDDSLRPAMFAMA